jgi:two-component system phosphate regulon response regulator OmpR
MSDKTILLLEDDPIIGEQIVFSIEAQDLEVHWSTSIAQCREYLSGHKPGLAIFDINLEDGNSLDLLEDLRRNGVMVPTIFLSAMGMPENIVRAFEAGANDFINKPIENRELMLRIRAHLRLLDVSGGLCFEGVSLNVDAGAVSYRGTEVRLNARQCAILAYLFENPQKVVRRERLLKRLRKSGAIDERTVDSHISQIRRRFRAHGIRHISIESVYRVGYRLTNHED